jgi:hypothetical protein
MLQEKLLELDEHDAVVGQMFSTLFQDAFDINIAILRNGAYHRFCNTLIFKSIIAQEEVSGLGGIGWHIHFCSPHNFYRSKCISWLKRGSAARVG